MQLKKAFALGFVVCFPLLLLAIGLFLCIDKSGFNKERMSSKLEYNDAWETQPLLQTEKELLINGVFSQPFYYVSSGLRTYVFVSEDRQYVMKFFNAAVFQKRCEKKNPLLFFQ